MKYIASCSFGKDSIATVILAHINNEPLDLIVYSEVMFDEKTSGENPLHRDFIYNVAIPKFKSWGYEVKVVCSNTTYVSSYYHVVSKSRHKERNGKLRGFLIPHACKLNDEGKVQPIRKFLKSINEPVIQYIGIAADEPKRLERLKRNKISLLQKYNYTEADAYKLCEEYGLLSPIYSTNSRNGCWFCPNAKYSELANIKKQYPNLWGKLETLNRKNIVSNKFNRKDTFEDLNKKLDIINKVKGGKDE